MHVLKKFLHGIDRLNYWVARIVSWSVVVIIAATVYEVIMRYIFNSPTIWVFEFNYLLHGPYFLLLGAYTFAINGHVNVDVFYGRFKPRVKAIIDLFTMPLFFFFIGMMFIYGGQFFLNSFSFRENLSSAWAPPVYPVKIIIPLAAALIMLQGIAKYIRCLHLAITGREGDL
jgi:TRAP-type mannitol/chloroaromatic compound transport system permease small subunit